MIRLLDFLEYTKFVFMLHELKLNYQVSDELYQVNINNNIAVRQMNSTNKLELLTSDSVIKNLSADEVINKLKEESKC